MGNYTGGGKGTEDLKKKKFQAIKRKDIRQISRPFLKSVCLGLDLNNGKCDLISKVNCTGREKQQVCIQISEF